MYKVKISIKGDNNDSVECLKYVAKSCNKITKINIDKSDINIYDNMEVKILYTKDDVNENDLLSSEVPVQYKILTEIGNDNSFYLNTKEELGVRDISYDDLITYKFKNNDINYFETIRYKIVFNLDIIDMDPDELESNCCLKEIIIEELSRSYTRQDNFPENTITITYDKLMKCVDMTDDNFNLLENNKDAFVLKIYKDEQLGTVSVVEIRNNNRPKINKKSNKTMYYFSSLIDDISITNERTNNKLEKCLLNKLENACNLITKYQIKYEAEVCQTGNVIHSLYINDKKIKWLDQWWEYNDDAYMHLDINNKDIENMIESTYI